jgi:hypothetical protein
VKYQQPFDQPDNPDASYVNANPGLGVRGSIPPAAAFEQAQREILTVIINAGITPADDDLTQLYQAIQALAQNIVNVTVNSVLDASSLVATIPNGAAGGTADAITSTLDPWPGALSARLTVMLQLGASANTGAAATFNANGSGAKSIVRVDGSGIAAGDLPAHGFALLVYDLSNTRWVLVAAGAVGSAATPTPSFVPGQVAMWAAETPPAGTLECDGSAASRSTYSRLFGLIGTAWGSGDGSTTFNLPDMRGRGPRGWSHGSANDPDRAARLASNSGGATGDHVGTKQADQVGSFSAGISGSVDGVLIGGPPTSDGWTPGSDTSANFGTGTLSGSVTNTASETRAKNFSIMFVIAY